MDLEVIVHLANRSFVPDSYSDPRSFYQTNVLTTLNLLELCRLSGARLIYLSSYVYGRPEYFPIDELHPPKPFNPYAQSKLMCEALCEGYSRDFAVPVVIFRPFNIYGPGQNKNFLIPAIIDQLKTGRVTIKDERPRRDYLHVEDLAEGILKALAYVPESGLEIFNMGYGRSHSVKEVVDLVTGSYPGEVGYVCLNEQRPFEVLDTVASVAKAETMLGWKPKIDLPAGLAGLLDAEPA